MTGELDRAAEQRREALAEGLYAGEWPDYDEGDRDESHDAGVDADCDVGWADEGRDEA